MMELQGEDGSIVELSETLKKELGRGPGIAPHDRSVSRRQVRLQVQRIAASNCHFRFNVSIEVVGPNPICVVHAAGGEAADAEVEIVKPGTQSLLKIGDKVSLSIQEPVFYTLARGSHLSGESGPRRNESSDSGKLLEDDQRDAEGVVAADADEEEGIAEAVARWQRRKQERLQADQRRSTQEGGATAGLAILKDHGDRSGEQVKLGRKQSEDVSQQELVLSHEPGQIERPTAIEDDTDVAKIFGFIVEGSEFEQYGKKGLDTSKWDWQIGRRPGNDSDDDEDEEEGGGQHNRLAAGLGTKQKAKPRNEDDDDDWRGDSEGEKELLSARKRPAPRKKDVQTRSHNLATTSETGVDPRKKRKLVSTSEQGPDIESQSIQQGKTKVSTASTSRKKISKQQSRASKEKEEDEEDDDGEDLDGFLVDDFEEQDEEVADDEDEWTDEDEDEEVEEDDEIEEDLAGGHAPGRPVMNKRDGGDDKPLCKYGNKCFRKNKDHLAAFRH